MNYETKYKQALYRARNFCERWDGLDVDSSSLVIKDVKKIFPELNEKSYGERIRKELIEHIKANKGSDYVLFKKFSPDDVIAWLEKQNKTLDPGKVIEWLKTKVYDDSAYGMAMIEQFKKDFGL